jgi:hypothetical protein
MLNTREDPQLGAARLQHLEITPRSRMSVTLAKIEELAPDQESLAAARKLLKPQGWPALAADGAGLVWGECQGSGSQPYRVVFSETDLGYKCTCPSRKFPCKHTIALMWMRADGRSFAAAERPGWVDDWLGRRRGPSAVRTPASTGPKDISRAPAAEPAPVDPKAESRAAAQRERNQAEREAATLAGLDELDLWLVDQLERGLAGFQSAALEQCRIVARRLVDAKAPGLAARVEQLPVALFGVPEPQRLDFLVENLGCLHLMAEAYRRQERLPAALKADLRQAVGWSLTREALLADPAAPRRRARWMVLATQNEVQPDKLRRLETWLYCLDEGDGPHAAVLIDFIPVSLGTVKNTYAPGEAFEAELCFYPSTAPLRALVAEQIGSATPQPRWRAPREDIGAALGRYEQALAAKPWLGDWPLGLSGAAVARHAEGMALVSAAGDALPLRPDESDLLLPLAGLDGIDAFGLWDGRLFDLKYAETPLGRWVGGAA